jgi:hypothetical protein
VGGVLLIPLGHTRWGFGRILGGDGGFFLAIPDLSREMGPIFDFGMAFGVEG